VGRVLAMSVTALLLVGCTGGGDDDTLEVDAAQEPQPEETEAPEPEQTEDPEPEPEDPYAVPDEIDVAYVDSVVDALFEVRASIVRSALDHQQGENLSADAMGLLFATTAGAERQRGMESIQALIDDPSRQSNFLPGDEMGAHRFRTERLIHVEPERCIIAIGEWDESEVLIDGVATKEFVALSLSRIGEGEEVSHGNPTPWQWRDNARLHDGTDPIPPEEWDDLDHDAALDHTCEDLG
jgi:hypothetical protein